MPTLLQILEKRANGWAHPPPVMARRPTRFSSKSRKMPLRTHAEGGRVEPVLGSPENNH